MTTQPTTKESNMKHLIVNESTTFGGETAAGIMHNRCVLTARDMGADWPEAFTYAVVAGWDDEGGEDDSAMLEVAARFGWDAELIAFIRDAHQRFGALEMTATS